MTDCTEREWRDAIELVTRIYACPLPQQDLRGYARLSRLGSDGLAVMRVIDAAIIIFSLATFMRKAGAEINRTGDKT